MPVQIIITEGLVSKEVARKAKDIAIVELRMPSFALDTQKQKNQFVERVTAIVKTAVGEKLPIENIWVNAVHAVDGIWGIGGKAYTNEDLGEAIGKAAES